MNRRNFIATCSLSLSGITLPTIINKKPTSDIVIGHNDFQYRVIKEWGILDSGKNPVNDCHEMVEDHTCPKRF